MAQVWEMCPRCEEGVLGAEDAPQEVSFAGVTVRLPQVRVERCLACGWQATSGREVGVAELLLAPQYASVQALVGALRQAGFAELFLREEEAPATLAFAARDFVGTLAGEVRELYLDSESGHVLARLAALQRGLVPVALGPWRCTVQVPKLGEGENGVVFAVQEARDAVLKLAKPRPYSRAHVREECEVTAFFLAQGVPVPAIRHFDPWGSFCLKERLAGESLAVLYPRLGPPEAPRHREVRHAVERFVVQLLELFQRHPEVKTSISPNNIFVQMDGLHCRCLLVDTGPAPAHDYSHFDFVDYWERVIPEKIARYRQVGYI